MKSLNTMRYPLSALALLGLAACGGTTGTVDEGVSATLKVATLTRPDAPHTASTHKHGDTGTGAPLVRFRRNDGMLIELERGLLNLQPVELVGCNTAAAWLSRFAPMGVAQAHAAHGAGEAPDGVLDVAANDADGFSLGSVVATPGTYCGLKLRYEPMTSAKHSDGGGSLSKGITLSPCYYPQTRELDDAAVAAVTADDPHRCAEIAMLEAAREFTLALPAPVTLDANNRTLDLTLAVRYEEWFDDVDLDQAANNQAQQARLIANIERSLSLLPAGQQAVTVVFDPRVNGAAAHCDATYTVGTGEDPRYRLRDYRHYVTDARLVGPAGTERIQWMPRGDGTLHQSEEHSVLLTGIVNGCSNTVEDRRQATTFHGRVPAGRYDQICFEVGLPFALNHSNVALAPSPLDATAMSWSWLTGRKAIRIDGQGGLGGETPQNFHLHLGSTGCSNGEAGNNQPPTAACQQPNVMAVCLAWDPAQPHRWIESDVARVFAAVEVAANTEGTAPGCMSGNNDPECVTVLPRLGLPFTFNQNGQTTVHPAQEQVFFRVLD